MVVHEKQHQSLALGSSQIMILDDCPLKSAADQGPVISLTGNTRMSMMLFPFIQPVFQPYIHTILLQNKATQINQ